MDSATITTDDLMDGARPLIGTAQAEAVRLSLGGLVGRHLVIAESQPQISRGALGSREIAVLRNAMAAALDQKLPFVLLLDSAGAKIDEGVLIQGEFRKLLSDALAFHASGNGFFCVLGRNVFGGASMLSMCAHARIYRFNTRLAMSGPRLLYAANPCKESVDSMLSAESRTVVDKDGYLVAGNAGEIKSKLIEILRAAPINNQVVSSKKSRADETVLSNRCSLDTTAEPYVIACKGSDAPNRNDVMNLIEIAEGLSTTSHYRIECEWSSHSLAIGDEACLQSQYLIDLAKTIRAKTAAGAMVTLKIQGEISGGLYIALASSCTRVELGAEGRVLTLPSSAVDLIKTGIEETPSTDQYLVEWGVIDAVANSAA